MPGDQELIEVAEAAPNAASGIVKLYRAYREQAARLSDLADLLAREGHETSLSSARLPSDEVRETLERRANFFSLIEDAAEQFHAGLGLAAGDDLATALKGWLRTKHGIVVRTLPIHTMPTLRRRYDRHSMRLFLSERLSAFDQLRELAMEVSLLALGEEIAAELEALSFSTGEAKRLGRFELARYAAMRLSCPMAPSSLPPSGRAMTLTCCDRALRLLRAGGQPADHAAAAGRPGHPLLHAGGGQCRPRIPEGRRPGLPQAKFGGGCPKLSLHAAFAQPGQVLAEAVEMPDGATFLTIARTLEGPQAGFGERVRRTALLVGCDIAHAGEVVYGAAATGSGQPPLAIGAACRLCERQGCLARAEPPITRPLGLDEMVTGLSAFDFQ